MAGRTQARIRRTMLDAGGYWRPLAAVARLLEELGELAELLDGGGPEPSPDHAASNADGAELGGELADLWIITTALADQFLAHVDEPATQAAGRPLSLGALLSAAGEIARVVNYYDGPKTPRATDALPSLADAVRRFHAELGLLAGALAVDLDGAVTDKLAVIRGRDMERFAREDSDPSTAPCLARLAAVAPETAGRRLWGAPALTAEPGRSAQAIAPSLASFLRAAGAERLEGYVIAVPGDAAEDWGEALLRALRAAQVAPEQALGLGAEGLNADTIEAAGETFLLLGRRVLSRPDGGPA